MKSIRFIPHIRSIATTVLFAGIFLCPFNLSLYAQNCKPDYTKPSPIDQKTITGWMGDLYDAGQTDVLIDKMPSKLQVTLLFGKKQDSIYYVALVIKKSEGKEQSAEFKTNFKGAKGNTFTLSCRGMKPLHFVAENFSNSTEMDRVWDELVTTVVLSDYIPEEDLPMLAMSLNKCSINNFKIEMENGITINQPVKMDYGKKIMEKAFCFERFLKEDGKLKHTTAKLKGKN